MALNPTVMRRQFRAGSLTLEDPGQAYSPEQVKAFYEDNHAFLQNYVVEGPTIKGDTLVYEFVKDVGDKG